MAISDFWKANPKPQRFFEEANHREVVIVRLEPTLHEVSIDPSQVRAEKHTLEQAMTLYIVEELRGLAVNAAHMVLNAGLSAWQGRPVSREDSDRWLDWVLEQKTIQIEAAGNRIEELEKDNAKKDDEIAVLERVIRNMGK